MLAIPFPLIFVFLLSLAGAILARLEITGAIIFCFVALASLFTFGKRHHFMFFVIASIILLFPIEAHHSSFIYKVHIHVIDLFFAGYLFIVFYSKGSSSPFLLKIPRHPVFIAFCAFASYNVVQLFHLTTPEGFSYGIFEIRKYLYAITMCLVIVKSGWHYKRMIQVMMFMILLSNIGGVMNSVAFLYRYLVLKLPRIDARHLIQISFYFSQCFILCIIGLGYFKQRAVRRFLIISAVMLVASMILDQTRGFWLSTLVALGVYVALFISRRRIFNYRLLFGATAFAITFTAVNIWSGFGTINFIKSRFGDMNIVDFVIPTTSVGYRVYETGMVLLKTSLFGHGLKAPLFLFLPWEARANNWYGIHSQYIEILYCLGIAGLILFMVFSYFYLTRAYRMAKHQNRHVSFFGKVLFVTYINTLVVSISSGFFMRFSSCLFLGYTLALFLIFSRGPVISHRRIVEK